MDAGKGTCHGPAERAALASRGSSGGKCAIKAKLVKRHGFISSEGKVFTLTDPADWQLS